MSLNAEIETGIIHLNNLPADVKSYVNRKANQANQTSEEWVTDLLIEKTAIMTKICPAAITGWDFHGKKVTICLIS